MSEAVTAMVDTVVVEIEGPAGRRLGALQAQDEFQSDQEQQASDSQLC